MTNIYVVNILIIISLVVELLLSNEETGLVMA